MKSTLTEVTNTGSGRGRRQQFIFERAQVHGARRSMNFRRFWFPPDASGPLLQPPQVTVVAYRCCHRTRRVGDAS